LTKYDTRVLVRALVHLNTVGPAREWTITPHDPSSTVELVAD
jgi:hypothetical protein